MSHTVRHVTDEILPDKESTQTIGHVIYRALLLEPSPASSGNLNLLLSFSVDFVIPAKGESLLEAYERWRGWADEKGNTAAVKEPAAGLRLPSNGHD